MGHSFTSVIWYRNFSGSLYNDRCGYYAVSGVPCSVFDGIAKTEGGFTDSTKAYNFYKNKINARTGVASPLVMSVKNTWITPNVRAKTEVTVTVNQAVTSSNNKLWAAIVEKNVNTGGYLLGMCGRAMAIYADFTLTQVGQSQTYTGEYDIGSGWNTNNLCIVVFVQTDNGAMDAAKEILQSGWGDVPQATGMKQVTWGSIKKLYQ
jgi:hypothetical protein